MVNVVNENKREFSLFFGSSTYPPLAINLANNISILNIHNHIIYYKVENKWFELSCRGLNVVKDEDNKDLNFCIDNLNKKDKYRKKNLSFNIRAIKLRYLLNNIKTEFFYLYKEKN